MAASFSVLLFAFLAAGVGRPAPVHAAPAPPLTHAQPIDAVRTLFHDGKYSEAETRGRALLAAAEASSGPRSLEVADVLDLLVRILERLGNSKQPDFLAFAERAVEIRTALLGPTNPRLAGSLHNLGLVHYVNQRLDEARVLFERSLAIRRDALGPDHPDVAESLDSMGLLQENLGHRDEAQASLERALEIRERALGPDHPDVAESLNRLATVRYRRGYYPAAEKLWARALEIRERALGSGHPAVAGSLHNLGMIHQVQGDYAAARTLYDRALQIRISALGTEHPATLSTHHALATLLQTIGDYAGARIHYRQALDGQAKYLGEDHPDYAHTVWTLALLLEDSGDYREAEALQRRALEIRRKVMGPAHPHVAESLTSLGHLLLRLGDAGALLLFEEALGIQEKALEPDHLDLARTLMGLGGSLEMAGDLQGAKRMLERSLAIYEKAYDQRNPILIMPLTELADVLERSGDLTGARRLHQRALQAAGSYPGAEFHRTAKILRDDGRLLARLGRFSESLAVALRGEAVATEHVGLIARSLPERQALAYVTHMNDNLDLLLSVLISTTEITPGDRKRVWNALIRSRALVLDEMAARHRTLRPAGDPEIERLSGELRSARQALANLVVRGPVGLPTDHYAKLAADARAARERAEEALAGRSLEFRSERALRQIDLDDVAAALPPRSGLVAYVLFNRIDLSRGGAPSAGPVAWLSTPTYLAFVARSGTEEPAMVLLGSATELDRCVGDWKREAAGGLLGVHDSVAGAETAYRRVAETLRQKIWDPLAEPLRGAERVFVVPDGTLNLVNLAALPVAANGYLVENGPEIHLLSAERDLVPKQDLEQMGAGLLVLGGADFDYRSRLTGGLAELGASAVKLAAAQAPQGLPTDCDNFQQVHFSPLPVTAGEIDEVISLWSRPGENPKQGALRVRGTKKRMASVVHLTGAEANERAFKHLAPGRRVLHLATHGFFFNGRCSSSSPNVRGIGGVGITRSESASRISDESPLLLSGLALAGANHRAEAGPGEEDGILTAEEVASLDLAGVEWAVLSACDTGVGEIRAGEGVLGLRRAFRIAGARTVVMSLWSVEDRAASVWMRTLYEGRLVEGLDTVQAVRNASRTVLHLRRARGESSHPFFWAGFVASGDWR